MAREIALTDEESEVITGYISTGGRSITADHVDELASALIKCTTDTCNKAMNYILNDVKLRREIALEIGKSSSMAISATDASVKKVLDNYKADGDIFRERIKTHGDDPDIFKMCVIELRRIEQAMESVNTQAQLQTRHIVDQEAQILNQAQEKTNGWKIAAGVAAGLAAGVGAGIGIGYAMGQNQNNNSPKITGKIK